MAQYGQLLAVEAHNPAALNRYSNLLLKLDATHGVSPKTPLPLQQHVYASSQRPDIGLQQRVEVLPEVLVSLRQWVREDDFSGLQGQLSLKELKLITKDDAHNAPHGDTGAFPKLCAGLSIATRRNYLDLLSDLGARSTIMRV